MKLNRDEADLVGSWVVVNGKVQADATCARIEWLTQNYLEKIATSKEWGGWLTLFRDPNDCRLWERTFPRGEMQGGPPRLAIISVDEARSKYEFA